MTKNEQLNEELYGSDFEVYRIDYEYKQINGIHDVVLHDTPIKVFDDIEEAFESVDKTIEKIVKPIRKKNPKSVIVYDPTEFGYNINVDTLTIVSVLIRELKREQVS